VEHKEGYWDMNNIKPVGNRSIFEEVKKINENGLEYWNDREMQRVLQYNSWDKFLNVIEKAKEACQNSGHSPNDHFSHTGKMVSIGGEEIVGGFGIKDIKNAICCSCKQE